MEGEYDVWLNEREAECPVPVELLALLPGRSVFSLRGEEGLSCRCFF